MPPVAVAISPEVQSGVKEAPPRFATDFGGLPSCARHLARDRHVVERKDQVADHLPLLVTFARDQHHIRRVRHRHRLRDRGAADVVLARAGSTVAELAAAGKASVLVPLPTAADDHQRKNAEVFAEAGAAVLLLQKDVTAESLSQVLFGLLTDGERRHVMGERARTLAVPGALERICKAVLRLARGG